MDNEIISLAPGYILDVIGSPQAPLRVPVPILPGLVFSTKGRGVQPAPMNIPYIRGSLRVSFVMEPSVGPSNVKVVAALGVLTGDPATDHGVSVVTFNDNTVAFVYSGGLATLYMFVTTLIPIPTGTPITVTGSWDSTQPIDGDNYGKMTVDGYGTVPTVMGINGTAPWVDVRPTHVSIALNTTNGPFVEDFLGEVGRFQVSNKVQP